MRVPSFCLNIKPLSRKCDWAVTRLIRRVIRNFKYSVTFWSYKKANRSWWKIVFAINSMQFVFSFWIIFNRANLTVLLASSSAFTKSKPRDIYPVFCHALLPCIYTFSFKCVNRTANTLLVIGSYYLACLCNDHRASMILIPEKI